MAMEEIKTRTAVMWLDDNGIFWVKLNPEVLIDKEDMADNLLVTRNITGNKPRLKVLDSRAHWKMNEDAREYFKKEDTSEKSIARAILVKSVANKLIKSILVKLYKPDVPLKFFTSESEAVKWLLNYKK
jgi:N-methylhydantoinase A/oxoprolinase/acetone carboxylase beta subunit